MEFKSQICTTHEQSKRLLALGLKPETADMVYHHTKSKVPALEWELQTKPPTLRGKFWTPQRIAKLAFPFHKHPDGSPMAGEEVFDRLWGEEVPAWSLCRLLELLPTEIRIGTSENVFGLHHETSDAWLLSYPYVKSFETASPVESCVLAIDWLIANGHFNKEYYNEKIMFNDKFGLTQAVLEGRKTMTRRIIKCPRTFRGEWVAGFNIHRRHSDKKIVDWPCMYDADEREFDMGEILPKYELGEVVAIAQSYMDVDRFHRKGKNAAYLEYLDSILPELKLHPGWTNKMFVKADLMPRHIEFTDRKVERLQDISDEDCLKEGIYEDSGDDEFPPSIFYEFEGNKDNGFDTPREAFAALIDKVSGKGTWESNPYVWAYEFELMK